MNAVVNDGNDRSIDELIAAQKPGYSLDQRFYTDPAVFERELERARNQRRSGSIAENILSDVGVVAAAKTI